MNLLNMNTAFVCVCVCKTERVCVAQGHVVKTPTVPPFHLPHTICQSFLVFNAEEIHHTLKWSEHDKGSFSVATWGSSEVLWGTHDVTRCNRLSVIQDRVAEAASRCHRHYSNWMSCCPYSSLQSCLLLSLALFLFFFPWQPTSELYKEISTKLTTEAFFLFSKRDCFVQRTALWQPCFIFLYKPIFCFSLPAQVALQSPYSCWFLFFLSTFETLFH